MYDASIGRFTGVDPIADQFAWASTYNYAENRPIGSIDLHGLQEEAAIDAAMAGIGLSVGSGGWSVFLFLNSSLPASNKPPHQPSPAPNTSPHQCLAKLRYAVRLIVFHLQGLPQIALGY